MIRTNYYYTDYCCCTIKLYCTYGLYRILVPRCLLYCWKHAETIPTRNTAHDETPRRCIGLSNEQEKLIVRPALGPHFQRAGNVEVINGMSTTYIAIKITSWQTIVAYGALRHQADTQVNENKTTWKNTTAAASVSRLRRLYHSLHRSIEHVDKSGVAVL